MSNPSLALGVPAHVTLDGFVLGESPEAYNLTWEPLRSIVDLAGGGRREQLLAPLPGYPEISQRCRLSLSWVAVRAMGPSLEARLAYAGSHRVCAWRHVLLAYRADGERIEYFLPPGWTSAVPTLTPPSGLGAGRFAPQLQIGFEADLTPVTLQPTATYETGTPPEGQAWLEIDGDRLKLGAAPDSGARVLLWLVPVIPMLLGAGASQQELRDPSREPRKLELVEGGV